MTIHESGYQVEIYDLESGKTEFTVQVYSEDEAGLSQARKERGFWERKCSVNWGVRIRKISNGMIM